MSRTSASKPKAAPRRRRDYSDREKGEALAVVDAEGGNVGRAARRCGVPRATLQDWASERGVNADVREERRAAGGELADRFWTVVNKCLDLVPEKLPELNAVQLMTCAAIGVDKALNINKAHLPQAPEEAGGGEVDADERARVTAALKEKTRTRLKLVSNE